jgi:hypothetical protein
MLNTTQTKEQSKQNNKIKTKCPFFNKLGMNLKFSFN